MKAATTFTGVDMSIWLYIRYVDGYCCLERWVLHLVISVVHLAIELYIHISIVASFSSFLPTSCCGCAWVVYSNVEFPKQALQYFYTLHSWLLSLVSCPFHFMWCGCTSVWVHEVMLICIYVSCAQLWVPNIIHVLTLKEVLSQKNCTGVLINPSPYERKGY